MKKTATILAVMLALGLGMAGCSKKDDTTGEAEGTMENAAGGMSESHDAVSEQPADTGMAGEGAAPTEAAPAETAPPAAP